MAAKSKPGIRPGYNYKYKKEYCQMVKEHMAKGFSFQSFGAVCEVTKDALYKWVDKYPEFREARDIAMGKNLLFWEQAGIEGLYSYKDSEGASRTFNQAVWIFNMRNRHGWNKDKEVGGDQQAININLSYDPEEKPE